MGKKKKKKKKQQDWTTQLKFELSGIAIVMLALIATFNFGSVGTILIQLFRFFLQGNGITLSPSCCICLRSR